MAALTLAAVAVLALATPCEVSAGGVAACFSIEAPALAYGGGIGVPAVITWASTTGNSGIAWGTTSQITGANASVTYNATSMLLNVPSAKSIAWQANAVTGLIGSIQSTAGWKLQSQAADGAAQIGLVFDNATTFATAGAKLAAWRNNGTEMLSLKWDSGLVIGTATAPNSADYGISTDGTSLIAGIPAGKNPAFAVQVGGTTQLAVSPIGTLTLGTGAANPFIQGPPTGALTIQTQSGGTTLTLNAPTGQVINEQVNSVTKLQVSGSGIAVGGGGAVKAHWTNGSAGTSFTFGSISTGTCAVAQTVSATGAANGDPCAAAQTGAPASGNLFFCQGNGSNQARVWYCNLTGASAGITATVILDGWDPN